jgi:hypothetical protein
VANVSDESAEVSGGDCVYDGFVKSRVTGYMSCTTKVPPMTKPAKYSELPGLKVKPKPFESSGSFSNCDNLGNFVQEWGARCYDDIALSKGDPSLCRSVHCFAYLTKNSSVCSDDQACMALAANDYRVCDDIYKSQWCKTDYALLVNDLALCRRSFGSQTLITSDICYSMFVAARGNTSVCKGFQKQLDRKTCEGTYWSTIALDKLDGSYCDNLKDTPLERNECIAAVATTLKNKTNTHPLQTLDGQFKRDDVSSIIG